MPPLLLLPWLAFSLELAYLLSRAQKRVVEVKFFFNWLLIVVLFLPFLSALSSFLFWLVLSLSLASSSFSSSLQAKVVHLISSVALSFSKNKTRARGEEAADFLFSSILVKHTPERKKVREVDVNE